MSAAGDRLSRSRLAILEFVHKKESRSRANPLMRGEHEDGEQWEAAQAAAATSGGNWFTRTKRAAQSYWRHHPARLGLQLAEPALSKYARQHPVAYLGIAAGAGALIMVARPWRLVSVTSLLLAAAKSPQLASVVMAAMSGSDDDDYGS